MFLKSLTLKGFKSFADTTTLDLEPGITVVVGPNGSGKSNIVDAVAWVLGAQGPRTLRSAKMEDVIFAGTSKRSALGRAEVTLTIDNSSGLIPIDFNEVTITRTLWRSGESEYAINGAPCRLLDVQELLSDTGVGRQQHVIVSQGQLDAVLNAQPTDRRLIIEEAAGVLKFRRRREKAQRRLEATEGNLLRVQDLLREVRRQLRPLERQADAARRHGDVVSELGALKLFLAGRELSGLRSRAAAVAGTRADQGSAERDLVGLLAGLDADVLGAEAALIAAEGGDPSSGRPRRDRLADDVARAEGLRERSRGLMALVAERTRSLERLRTVEMDADLVSSLESEAAELSRTLADVELAAERMIPEAAALVEAEGELAGERAEFEAMWQSGDTPNGAEPDAEAPRPAGAAEVRGELVSLQRAAERGDQERRRLADRESGLRSKAARLESEAAELSREVAAAAGEARTLDDGAAQASAHRLAAEGALEEAEQAFATVSGQHRSWSARAEALAMALDQARSRAGAERLAAIDGLVGTLLDVIEVDDGWGPAFEAAIGEAVTAVVVDGVDAARLALSHLHRDAVSGAVLALQPPGPLRAERWSGLVAGVGEVCASYPGAHAVRAHVRTDLPAVDALLDRLLAGAVAVPGGWSVALDVALEHPGLVVVTPEGDRFADAGWRAGVGSDGATGAALEEARTRTALAEVELQTSTAARQAARLAAADARSADVDAARAADRHTARRVQASTALERIKSERREIDAEAEVTTAHLAELVVRLQRDEQRRNELAALLPGLEADEAAGYQRAAAERAARGRIEQQESALRALRTDLEVRAAGLEERRALLGRRRADIEGRLGSHLAARAAAEQRRLELTGHVVAVERLGRLLALRASEVDGVLEGLREERRIHAERTAALTGRLDDLRHRRQSAERDLVATRERLQRAELEDAEIRVRLESATEGLRRDLDVEPDVAIATMCPPLPPGTTAEHRARELERDLRLMGPINPLALEEHAALMERHGFLEAQLEDVKTGRRELAKVIRAVDTEIVEVFSAAYADVADNFTTLFGMLFPGGTGRLRLTDPDNLLETGIEVEARPSGKNVKRLSLLSGGERSLTAMAFLFAVFRSRPSPFYLMDEVEAALDDVNLHRFLDLIREFRSEAQLLIVSHQKRTMEAADLLYGVTMQPGGSSRVISERVGAGAG
ncbi:MAG: chromosome segregation protein SMC [Acidimicrobiales bacterium]